MKAHAQKAGLLNNEKTVIAQDEVMKYGRPENMTEENVEDDVLKLFLNKMFLIIVGIFFSVITVEWI